MEGWFDEEIATSTAEALPQKQGAEVHPQPFRALPNAQVSCSWMQPSPHGDDGAILQATSKPKKSVDKTPAACAPMAAKAAAQAEEANLPHGVVHPKMFHLLYFLKRPLGWFSHIPGPCF